MKMLLRGSLLCALLLSTASAAAEITATLIGTVTEAASGKPLVDVVVTASSPALEGEHTVLTDAQGNYRIPGLPPGVYTLLFEQEYFEQHARQDLQLRQNRTVRLNVMLRASGVEEVKEPSGQTVTIDVGSTTTGINVDLEFIKRIAVARPGRRNLAESGCYRSCWLSDRDRTPSWMLSRQVISVPDGTPQLVYRAPSADRYSPDFGSR